MVNSVLFVCLGNICRSPAAEGIVHKLSENSGLSLSFDSAGTSGWHTGEQPYAPMRAAALQKGYDLSNLRARLFKPEDFSKFDLILAMDNDNLKQIEKQRPAGDDTPVQLFLDYAPDQPVREMPDPYYTRTFNQVVELIEYAGNGLVSALRGVGGGASVAPAE
ncbi:low molecular weight protein-tyrosine-phosphatase [Ponticaulis sp.]|uniref:low molecular weight protein-tyrosine-phosphatase n=1 Tax=Ponticaulis sp. TaxID=2020902 RepID=UPI000B74645D|nr:low molecular weight protein-tyrosine-phosphatase [Ponticaulis sp.]MAI90729.1 phosphotyrosine protein phosphatase [Ponticaulis sp.]OUX98959.1 MAG: phosphotyrosine protein phosphatase [Hyphomonadaceae bacterium TMED5]|tara:strand:- start:13499 stop:13987 length:489 start_codon:yes stop_codon:yes gene_type:complete